MSQRRAKAKRASVVPKVLSLADRASAALDTHQRTIEADRDAATRSAEAQATSALRQILYDRGLVPLDQAGHLPVSVEVTIEGGNVYAVPFATIDGLRFRLKQVSRESAPGLLLEVECHLCGGKMWSHSINGLIALGMALKAKWQHPEGTCPRVTESPRHSRNERKRT